jgi:hypothetical protein
MYIETPQHPYLSGLGSPQQASISEPITNDAHDLVMALLKGVFAAAGTALVNNYFTAHRRKRSRR